MFRHGRWSLVAMAAASGIMRMVLCRIASDPASLHGGRPARIRSVCRLRGVMQEPNGYGAWLLSADDDDGTSKLTTRATTMTTSATTTTMMTMVMTIMVRAVFSFASMSKCHLGYTMPLPDRSLSRSSAFRVPAVCCQQPVRHVLPAAALR